MAGRGVTAGTQTAARRGTAGTGEARFEHDAGAIEQKARREELRPGFRRMARFGLVSRAVVYLLTGALTLEIAVRGRSGAGPSSQGAFVEVASQPGGRVLLVALAAGLLAYAAARVVMGIAGSLPPSGSPGSGGGAAGGDAGRRDGPGRSEAGASDEGSSTGRGRRFASSIEAKLPPRLRRLAANRSAWARAGSVAAGAAYLVLFAEALAIVLGSSSGGAGNHPDPYVARILRAPGGPGYVALIGVAVATGGVALAIWGAVHRYDSVLDTGRMGAPARVAARVAGTAGDAARGVLVVLVAGFLIDSAVSDQPTRARAVSGAVESLRSVAGGPELLGLLGSGLLAFAVYSLFEAAYRRF